TTKWVEIIIHSSFNKKGRFHDNRLDSYSRLQYYHVCKRRRCIIVDYQFLKKTKSEKSKPFGWMGYCLWYTGLHPYCHWITYDLDMTPFANRISILSYYFRGTNTCI